MNAGNNIEEKHLILMGKNWAQQSGSTNAITGGAPFNIRDVSPADLRIINFTGTARREESMPLNPADPLFDEGAIQVDSPGRLGITFNLSPGPFLSRMDRVVGFAQWQTNSVGGGQNVAAEIRASSGNSTGATIVGTGSPAGPVFRNLDIDYTAQPADTWMTEIGSRSKNTGLRLATNEFLITSNLQCSFHFYGRATQAAYKRHSIFSPVVNSGDIAISTNPAGIFDDIASNHLSLPYHQDQSSAAQADINSIHLQCFFAERTLATDIFDEFGRLASTYFWVADSGMIKIKTYQESGTATNSVNLTVTTCNIFPGTIQFNESPLGTTLTEQDFASQINVDYAFDFQLGKFAQGKRANPQNNALCGSMNAGGVTKSRIFNTKYITDPDVASYYLGSLVRKYCQGNEFITFQGGPSLLNLELADVIKLQHPMITGSEGLYQVIQSELNVMDGTNKLTVARLLAGG